MDLTRESSTQTGTANTQDRDNSKFEIDDACRLKSDPSLVGTVGRTFYDVDTHGPLDEFLILSYAPVPEATFMDFMSTGKPPKGYVFVTFDKPAEGSSLVHEDDLELVDRALSIGQGVKRHLKDTISGTVISVSAKCSLEPIAFRILDPVTGEYGPVHLTEKRVNWPNYPPPEDVPPPPLIHDVPLSDVRHYEDLTEGDYVVYRQKVGVIQQINRDVVLLLRNQTVVLPNAYSFETPLPFGSRPIVSLPSPQEDLKSYPLEKDEVLWAEHSDTIYPGQFIMTDAKSLRTGDWVSGSYSDSELPEGHVLATPALDVHVDWVCPNVFAVGMPYVSPDSEVIRWSTLQGEAVRCDFGKLPGSSSNGQRVGSDAWLCIGDRVTFRDPADAAAKYPQFQPIPADQTWGYNLNIFRIVSTKTEVRVQWQDLSVTTEDATALRTFTSLQDEVWPGELVALREGTDRIPNPSRERPEPLSAHFQGYKDDNILVPKKIGVVQAVDSGERIASVRWYKDPKVELLHDGYILRPSSVLGELGDEITDVSMYELTKHSGLGRARGDMVLVVPDKIHESLIPSKSHGPSSTAAGPCPLSYLFPITFWQLTVYLHYMKMVLVELNWFKSTVEIDSTPLPPRHSVHRDDFSLKSPVNFVGRIIALDLDGTITVRLAAANNCRDVRVPLEKILMVIDDEDMPQGVNFPALHVHNLDIYEADDTSILQSIEYEGGQRIDNDSGDDMWTTEDDGDDGDDGDEDSDEEDDGDNVESEVAEIKVPDKADSEKDETESSQGKLPAAHDNELPILSMQQPTVCPPSFTVLDTSPPSDHVFLSKPATEASRTRIKRIRKEYQILESSLPLGIFARTWESRIDLLRVLIIGPQGTPYEYAPYIIDFYFGEDFPNVPPASFFHSWTNGMGRINPNLYEDGKICLSILGTWPSQKPGENWSPVQSTVLQILVSLMGLVLVKVPFYNEAGFEIFAAEGNSRVESTQYTEKAFVMTRNFIKHALQRPVAGFEDVLMWHYLPGPAEKDDNGAPDSDRPRLLRKAIAEANAMIEHHDTSNSTDVTEDNAASPFTSRLSLGAVVMLRKYVRDLEMIEAAATERFS